VSELRGEKIDIIPFNEEPARFVAKALSPARVREVLVDDEAKQATVIVPDDQLSLAIGKDGLNARLAARLTGWRVDIRSETEFAEDEAEMGYQEEEVSGRCATILANGKRCPNASLPGSRYCGLPAHQALEGTGTDYLVPPEDEGESEGDAEPAASANGDLPVEDLVEAVTEDAQVEDVEDVPVEDAPVEDAPVATADEVVEDGVAEVEAAQENEEMDAGEAPPAGDDDAPAEEADES
jgi:N utilization substance protein A